MSRSQTHFWKLIVLMVLLNLSHTVMARCTLFDGYIQQGDASFHNGDFLRAVEKYISAMIDCPYKAGVAQGKLNKVISELQGQIDSLKTQQKSLGNLHRGIRAQQLEIDSLAMQIAWRTDSLFGAIDRSLILKSQMRYTSAKHNRLIDSLPVSGRPITLAIETVEGMPSYYFINRLGEELKKLKRWVDATQFDKAGFAIVEGPDYKFILDTTGIVYTLDDPQVKEDEVLDYSFENRWHLPKTAFTEQRNVSMLLANGNRFLEIPSEIRKLQTLEYLSMADNRLRKFHQLISNFKLETIDLEGNMIDQIPINISNLVFLKSLNLTRNRLSILPAYLFKLSLLKDLRLAHNRIAILPTAIGELDSLETLDLSFNALKSLPSSISKLSKLKSLGLTGNQLKGGVGSTWIQHILKLKQLKYLRLGANPCTDTEEERNKIKDFIRSELPDCIVFFN